jgi:hypothetical protein
MISISRQSDQTLQNHIRQECLLCSVCSCQEFALTDAALLTSTYFIFSTVTINSTQHKAIRETSIRNSDPCALQNFATCSKVKAISYCIRTSTYRYLVPSSWLIWATLPHSIRGWRRLPMVHLPVDLVLEWQDELKKNITFTFNTRLVVSFAGVNTLSLNTSGDEHLLSDLCFEICFS